MKIGKVSEITYRRSVLKQISSDNEGLKPGVYGAPISLEDITAVVSSNCILKQFCGCEEFYLNKTINDIYEKAAIPTNVFLEINIPENYEEKFLSKMIRKFDIEVKEKGISLAQCKVYRGNVDSPITHVSVIGKRTAEILSDNIEAGMDVVMTGSIAIGGTYILSHLYEEKLSQKFSKSFVETCKNIKDFVSLKNVVENVPVSDIVYMHSISEGGAFSAIWELASCCNMGIQVDINKIPVWQEVIEVSELLEYNPYLIDGTGSMLIVARDGNKIVEELSNKGIHAEVIGMMTKGNDRIAVNGEEVRYLEPPRGDEIYKFL